MPPRDFSYLHGEGPEPDGIPGRAIVPDTMQFLGSGGVRATQQGDRVVLGFDDDILRRVEEVESSASQTSDPFSEMAFRCSWVAGGDGSILVKKGYISHSYWDATDGWITDQFPIPSETVALSSPVYPMFFYLVVPVAMAPVASDADGPYELFDGSASPSNIEGTDYDFFAEIATTWLKLDQTPPASYFLATDTPPTPDATHYRLLLAEIPEEGAVRQKTFGDVKLPQRSIADITSLSVAPH